MQYMLLLFSDPANEPQYGTPAFAEMMEGYGKATAEMKAAGVFLHGDGLQGSETATSLRVRKGKVETMDGPFAVTKEQLGGYYQIEVADLDAALKWAAKIPAASLGTVEVRPVMIYD